MMKIPNFRHQLNQLSKREFEEIRFRSFIVLLPIMTIVILLSYVYQSVEGYPNWWLMLPALTSSAICLFLQVYKPVRKRAKGKNRRSSTQQTNLVNRV